MKRAFLVILVVAALSLACAGAALAAPLGPAEGISIFAEYSDLWVEGGGLIVGAGYGFSESLAFGAFLNPDWTETVGLYGCFASDPFRVSLELKTDFAGFNGLISGLYFFDLDPLALGVGAGATIGSGGGSSDFFARAMAEYMLDAISIYGGIEYFPGGGDEFYFSVGASYAF